MNDILLNQKQIKEQNSEMLRLRAVLLTNEQKLKQWAKIKSRKFRKIHNREARNKKMQKLIQKLSQVSQIGQVVGLDDYAQDLVKQQIQVASEQVQDNIDLKIKTGEVDGEKVEKKGIMSLKFMANYLDKQERLAEEQESSDEVDENGNLVPRLKVKQQQSYKTTAVANAQKKGERDQHKRAYDDNPFLDGIDGGDEGETAVTRAQKKLAKKVFTQITQKIAQEDEEKKAAEDQLDYDPDDKYKKFVQESKLKKLNVAQAFEDSDDIQALKDAQARDKVDGEFEEELPGWGEWIGAGVSEKQRQKLEFKQEVLKQQRINAYLKEQQQREDAGKSWFFKSQQPVNKDIAAKYNARGINVSDEEYARYLKQQVTPEFQSVSATRYVTQKERNLPRGLVVNQRREMEENVRQLSKIQQQLEEQKVYVKGQKMDTSTRKAQF